MKTRMNSRPRVFVWMQLLCVLVGVSGSVSSFAATSRLYPPTKKQAGVLRVTVVEALFTRADILTMGADYDRLIASGIDDSDLRDGSVAVGKTFCCGRTDSGLAMFFYIPPDLDVAQGDIVEVEMGRELKHKAKPREADVSAVNTVRRVRIRNGENDGICWWNPREDYLWRRVLYCKWMEEEGWTLAGGVWKAWIKPVPMAGRASRESGGTPRGACRR